eukprot:gene14677-5768_t
MFGSSTVAPQVAGVLSGASSTISEVKYALFSRCAKCVSYRRYTKSLSQQESSSTTNEDAKSSNVISKQAIQDLGLKDLPNDWLKKVDIPNTAWLNLPDERSKPWNISHVSAETFFQNKHGFDPSKIYHEEHLRAGVSLFSIFKGKENLLAIINEDPEYVIRRCESGQFAINDDVITQYFKALVLTDKVSSSEIQALGNAALSKTGSKGNSNLNAFNPDRGTEDQPVHVVMNPAKGSFFREQFWNTLRFLIGLFLILSVIEAQLQMKMTTNQKEIMPDQSEKRVKFSDVQGCDEAKQELKEVVEFLRSPDKFTKLGGKLPTGVLLIGPPGTGKTLLARAVAGEAGVPFFFCSGSEFDEMFVGVGAARVRNLFTAAKEHSPCIVFVDELDAIGGTRIPNDHQPYSRMTLNQLLVELDGFDKTEGIVVIGATNFPEILDKALTRPGRFDSKVIVAIPDVRGRKEILDLYLKTVPCGDDVDSTVIARGTPGFSGADLNNLVNQAAIRAAVESDPYVTLKHLEWAKDKIIMGPERKNAVIEEKNRILVAYHESGHAVVAMYTPDALPVHKATIMPRGQALGMVSQLPEKDELSWSKKQLLAKMDVCMGGRVAEEIIFGKDSITTGASSDMETATKIATAMVVKYGMSEKVGVVNIGDTDKLSPSLRATVENEINTLLKESYERARSILTARASEHKRLAEGLLVHETLDSDELKLVVQGKQLPSKI